MKHRLRFEREQKRLYQEEIAKLLGISKIAYADKENGSREFKASEMFILSKFFGIKIDKLFLDYVVQKESKDE